MNFHSKSLPQIDRTQLRKVEALKFLAELTKNLSLTDNQLEAAKTSYTAVGKCLSSSDHPYLRKVHIYVHGSTALGTSVKPLGREEHDVDLIAFSPAFPITQAASELKALIGKMLREDSRYASMLEEKKRCWRLNYAREFHLDITPAIPNPRCPNGGELVPDKMLKSWKPTNPRGYKNWFEERAKLRPQIRFSKSVMAHDAAAESTVEAFPDSGRKGVLRLIVQLLKRHRDIWFQDKDAGLAPISIIITTLASQAYEYNVLRHVFDTELDLMVETIRMMPHFIEVRLEHNQRVAWVPNETTEGENFADRWKSDARRAVAFSQWQAQALADFESIASAVGMDVLSQQLEKAFGDKPVRQAVDHRTQQVTEARRTGGLFIAPTVGLTTILSAAATPVRRNTYFGDQ